MSNTTVVQYTRTHSAAHVSQKRSDVILIMKTIRNQIEDGFAQSHESRGTSWNHATKTRVLK